MCYARRQIVRENRSQGKEMEGNMDIQGVGGEKVETRDAAGCSGIRWDPPDGHGVLPL